MKIKNKKVSEIADALASMEKMLGMLERSIMTSSLDTATSLEAGRYFQKISDDLEFVRAIFPKKEYCTVSGNLNYDNDRKVWTTSGFKVANPVSPEMD